uniref:Uncharacterized protein n=1 Tax=Heterorhabditis bacteriophora TaxID=37862 RepID=A0A1I7XRF9_HETBA
MSLRREQAWGIGQSYFSPYTGTRLAAAHDEHIMDDFTLASEITLSHDEPVENWNGSKDHINAAATSIYFSND